MRDQTWKTLTYTAVFFLGVVGFEIKGANDFVIIFVFSVNGCSGVWLVDRIASLGRQRDNLHYKNV